jgi:hypothetical protein
MEVLHIWNTPPLSSLAYIRSGTNPRPPLDVYRWAVTGSAVVRRNYFTRQAKTLLNFAKSTSDPNLAAVLIDEAADLKSRLDESNAPDQTPLAPDVEPPAK